MKKENLVFPYTDGLSFDDAIEVIDKARFQVNPRKRCNEN